MESRSPRYQSHHKIAGLSEPDPARPRPGTLPTLMLNFQLPISDFRSGNGASEIWQSAIGNRQSAIGLAVGTTGWAVSKLFCSLPCTRTRMTRLRIEN